jgi:zinc protease
MAVVVVGDLDPALAEKKVKEYFGRIPKAVNPKKRIEFPVPNNVEPLISVVTDKEAPGYVAMIGFKHPKSNNITYTDYRNQLMRSLYTGMLNNRLSEIRQKPDAPFMFAGADYGSFVGRTIDAYMLQVSSKENQIDKSLEVVLTENERVRKFGFTGSELDRQKKTILTMYEKMAKESDKTQSAQYADEFVRNYLDQECIPGIQKEFDITKELMPGISLDEINKLGQKWITDENMIGLVTAPQKEGTTVPTESQIMDIIKSVKGKQITAYKDNVSDAPILSEVPKATKVVNRIENKDFGFTELSFGNGVRMILKPTDYKNDEILLSAYSPGGSSLYPDNDVMTITYATRIINQSGLGDFSFIDLQKKLSGNTAKLNPIISTLTEGVSGNCSPKDMETMLQLNYLYFTKIRKDENSFTAFISQMKNQLKPMRSVPQMIFQDTLTKIIYQNSPRAIAVPTDAQIDQINLDRLLVIFKERFADASDFTYLMIGNFKVDDVIPMLEKYIGGLPSIKRQETWKDVTPKFPKGLVNVEVPKNSEPQSQVAMVWKGDFTWNDKDRQCFTMMMNVLSIKCRESMREDQGGVYGVGINGSAQKFPKPMYTIQAGWGCSPENIKKLSQTVLDEMSKITKDGPTDIDLNKVKETLFRERESRMKENSFWLSALQNQYYQGDKILSLDDFRNFVNSITKDDIKAIAIKYLNFSNYVQVALTPAAK